MAKAQVGDQVKVHYTGRLVDGTEFDTSVGTEPLQLTLGDGHVITGFENAIVGMETGETKTVTISPEEAYGPENEELVVSVSRERLPRDLVPAVGEQLQMKRSDGEYVDVVITGLGEKNVTIDANHPLAGHALVFDIHLVAIG